MTRLICLHGTGDTYLVCALARAFEREHRTSVTVVCKSRHAVIPEMFGLSYVIDDALVDRGETDGDFQREHENEREFFTGDYFVHPSFVRSGVRVDRLTAKRTVCQADMYRALLHLSIDAPLGVPDISGISTDLGIFPWTFVIPTARSWQPPPMDFWARLADRLRPVVGHKPVVFNQPALWDLRDVFGLAAVSKLVFGPQCGVMSILCAARFPCRKVFVTRNWTPDGPGFCGLTRAFPYGTCSLLTGEDFDVDEYVWSDGPDRCASDDALIDRILSGSQVTGARPYDLNPVTTIDVPMTPGDLLDRLAVLNVKYHRAWGTPRAAATQREYLRYHDIAERAGLLSAIEYSELVTLHAETYDFLEKAVPAGLENAEALELNHRRVSLRRAVDARLHAPYREVKSYWEEQGDG